MINLKVVKKSTYICVKLPNKAWEIVVLEVSREETNGKGLRIPNNKAVVTFTPRNNMVCAWIFYYIISFGEKWRRTWVMESLHWLWTSWWCHPWWVCTWTTTCILLLDRTVPKIHGWESTDLTEIERQDLRWVIFFFLSFFGVYQRDFLSGRFV